MATIKSYTDVTQSKTLSKILPLESADMYYKCIGEDPYDVVLRPYSEWKEEYKGLLVDKEVDVIPCWSLAALLECMNRNFYNISLNYCGSEYTISFDDNERYKTITKDYSIDAAFEMVVWLKETNRI